MPDAEAKIQARPAAPLPQSQERAQWRPREGAVTDTLIDTLIDKVPKLVGHYAQFYVGHTSNLEQARREHEADEIITLYKTNDAIAAFRVAETVAQITRLRARSRNAQEDRYGHIEDPPYFVYLALWQRSPTRKLRYKRVV